MVLQRRLVAVFAVFSLIVGFTISSTAIAGAAPPPSPTVPAAPTSLVAYRGNASAEIAFTAGANGGAAITNYKYQLDDGSWTEFSPAVTSSSVTIGGLTNGTTYSVKLRAVNSAGDGAVSGAVSVTPADVNAINWTGRTPAETNNWSGVAYGNGVFVAVSTDGTNRVMTSPDGVTWTARSAPNSQWMTVTYGNGLFVAVADWGSNLVMTSPDGINWTARSAAASSYWRSVTYGNGLFVAVAWNGASQVMTSPDGINWTARSVPEANGWKSVTYGNGTFVAVSFNGTNQVMTSSDGITWTARSEPGDGGWGEVKYGNGTFVAVANSGTDRAMTSPDGITWTVRSAPEDQWQSLTYGNGNFVSAGYNTAMYSTDGTTWTSRPAVPNNWSDVVYANGRFVAVADGGSTSVMTSELTEPSTPEAPTSLEVTIGKGSASVAFTAGPDGGSEITNYEYQLNGSGAWTALSPAAASSPVTIGGLTNGTSYTVKLRAVNSLGVGAASAASASFTPLLRLVTPAQPGTLSILAGTGSAGTPTPGPAASSSLSGLDGLAVDPAGNTYIADFSNNQVFKISSGGTLSVFAGTGTAVDWSIAPPAITPGPAISADLTNPNGLAVDSAGNLYVAVTGSRQVVKITPEGTLSIVAGTGQWFDPMDWESPGPVLTPGPATSVDLDYPTDLAVDSAGNLYILDFGYRQVLKVTTDGTLSVVAGSGSYGPPTPGPATDSAIGFPSGIAVDSSGNLYIADSDWSRSSIYKVTSSGTISTFAGNGSRGLPTPGPATSSSFGELYGVAVDPDGNVLAADFGSNVVVKITPSGTLMVVAGTGYQYSPTPGPVVDSDLGSPNQVAVDSAGSLFILDGDYYLLEKVTLAPNAPTGLVATPGDGSVSISFTPGANGGSAITKYQYRVGSGAWTDAVGTTSPITVTGLTNGIANSVRLRAVNSVGAGAASSPVSVTPRQAGPASPAAATPSGSTGFVVTFSLNPLPGTTVAYQSATVYLRGTNTVAGSCRTYARQATCYIGGLTRATNYDLRITAYLPVAGKTWHIATAEGSNLPVRTNN